MVPALLGWRLAGKGGAGSTLKCKTLVTMDLFTSEVSTLMIISYKNLFHKNLQELVEIKSWYNNTMLHSLLMADA